MNTAPFRLLRSCALALAMVGLASIAHLSSGGFLPAPAIMLALLMLTILGSTLVTAFKLGAGSMLIILGSSQVLLHEAFGTLSTGSTAGVSASAVASMNHHMPAGLSVLASESTMTSTSTTSGLGMSDYVLIGSGMAGHAFASLLMFSAHAGATVLMALILFKGESALWALASWLRPIFAAAKPSTILAISQNSLALPVKLPQQPCWDGNRPYSPRGPPLKTVAIL